MVNKIKIFFRSLPEKPYLNLALFLLLSGLEGLVIFLNAIIRGNNTEILQTGYVIASYVFVGLSALLIALAIRIFNNINKPIHFLEKTHHFFSAKPSRINWIIPLICLIFLIISSLFILEFGSNNEVVNALTQPVSTWFYLMLLQIVLIFVLIKQIPLGKKNNKVFLLSMGIFTLISVFVLVTRVGITPDERFWNVAGVPVLLNQFVLVILLAYLVDFLSDFIKQKTQSTSHLVPILIDGIICIVIWAGAAFLWTQAPFSNSFFAEGPFPPNDDFYPYSDAALTDLGGQYMLIGEGLEYPYFTEKPLYSMFLGLLHLFAGQNYLDTTTWQIAIFACFPVLLYILGVKFGNRFLGTSLALFAAVKEYNAIFSTFKISVSNSRLYLSEFPMAICMVTLAISLFFWFSKSGKNKVWIIISGGVLGISTLIRANPILLLPCIIVFSFFAYKWDWKKISRSLVLFLAGLLLAVAPWTIYNQVNYGTNPYTYKIKAVIQTRFLDESQDPAPTGNGVSDEFLLGQKNTEAPKVLPYAIAQTSSGQGVDQSDSETSTWETVAGHFLNNEIKALFVLPFQLYPLELTPVLDSIYWEEPIMWQGELPLGTLLALITNIAVIAIGIAYAWNKFQYTGLIPLVINVGYYFSNALGRTSGSRYLLAVDWTVYLYFFLGITAFYIWIKNHWLSKGKIPSSSKIQPALLDKKEKRSSLWVAAGLILLAGISIPLINTAFPKLYNNQVPDETMEQITSSVFLQQANVTEEQISETIAQNNGEIIFGRMLYPRYKTFRETKEFGLFLTLLTPDLKEVFFHFDEDDLLELPAGSEVIIVGCQRDGYIEGFVGYIPDSQIILKSNVPYTRDFCNSR
ncbi:MAG: hypothetical protein WA116_03160 [Anaerolineaceae bacterium]